MKEIKFNDKNYKIKKFQYFSKRIGLMFINTEDNNDSFNGTLDIDSIKPQPGQIIIKSHDFNRGLLEVLIENEIIGKQAIPITFGFNKVYICKLKQEK